MRSRPDIRRLPLVIWLRAAITVISAAVILRIRSCPPIGDRVLYNSRFAAENTALGIFVMELGTERDGRTPCSEINLGRRRNAD